MPKRQKLMTPEALEMVAGRFRLLGDPMRLRIIQALEDGELSVNEIAAVVEATQPNVSKHLKLLQEAGLLARRPAGNTVCYSIADETVFEICEVVCSSLQQRLSAQAGVFSQSATTRKRR